MIKVENLTKRFGHNLAVDNVSFSVDKGQVLGFLGPNGAGKSTTMRMITGFISANMGTVTLGGFDIEEDPIKAKSIMGYLPENAPAYGDMTVIAFLKFIASLRGLSGSDRMNAVEGVVDTCFLQSVRNQSIDTLSKGYLHRTCFAQSIIHDPEILILDEPTDGLDPNQKYEVRNLIKRMGERKAIIISTHILEEVDAVCSDVIIINNGKLVASGIPSELKEKSKSAGSINVTVVDKSSNEITEEFQKIDEVDKVICLNEQEGQCRVQVIPKDKTKDELSCKIHHICMEKKWILKELHPNLGKLDDVFRDITTSDRK